MDEKASRGYGMIHNDGDGDNDAYDDDKDDDERDITLRGYGMIHNDEDGDNDANDGDDDERKIRTKKYRGLNSSDGGNTEDRVKIVGGGIGSGDGIEFSEELKELLPDEDGK
ncbi:hypothetical protein Tco_0273628 [Tanacetum coccineum]